MGRHAQKEVVPKENTFFVIETYVEDVKQDERNVPDFVESVMRPTDPVEEELRRSLGKMNQFSPR